MSNITQIATFAGGCFWCIEAAFDELPGVFEVTSGYTGGDVENPSYEQVCTGTTGHYEAVQIKFDPTKTTYKDLLTVFWKHIDPTDGKGQFADKGPQYLTAIFYQDDEQKQLALQSKKEIEGLFEVPVFTKVIEAKEFYPAEKHHQKYYKKCPIKYNVYKSASRREEILNKLWNER